MATEAALQQSRSERARAEDAVGQVANMNARVAAAEAAVHSAELDLEYTRVPRPVQRARRQPQHLDRRLRAERRRGVHARRHEHLVRDGELPRNAAPAHSRRSAPVDLYLQSQPGRHFRGTVVGLGWAVLPENGTSVNGLPRVERSLDWIRLAARFPVRIKVEDPDESFRIGASAVATVHGSPRAREPVTGGLVDFLRRELAPTPGRGHATFRLTLACLIVTIPILTHRIPLALVA